MRFDRGSFFRLEGDSTDTITHEDATFEHSPNPEESYLLLYGTLRHGSEYYEEFALDERLTLLGECTVEGLLYDLGEYPGLRLESEATGDAGSGDGDASQAGRAEPGLVTGECYRVDDETVFPVLDAFEGYDPTDREGSLFVRRLVRLDEPPVDAWTYVYNRDVGDATVIESGDWRAYADE